MPIEKIEKKFQKIQERMKYETLVHTQENSKGKTDQRRNKKWKSCKETEKFKTEV